MQRIRMAFVPESAKFMITGKFQSLLISRKKNDRNDAEFLARMLSVGNVVEVWVPDDGCEAARDLVRALADARDEVQRSKQMLSKFLLRHGLVFDEVNARGQRKKNWTADHWAWIHGIRFAEKATPQVEAKESR